MKTIEIAAPERIDDKWHLPEDGQIDVEDDLADTMEREGRALIVKHNGVPIVWGACCTHHDGDADHQVP